MKTKIGKVVFNISYFLKMVNFTIFFLFMAPNSYTVTMNLRDEKLENCPKMMVYLIKTNIKLHSMFSIEFGTLIFSHNIKIC